VGGGKFFPWRRLLLRLRFRWHHFFSLTPVNSFIHELKSSYMSDQKNKQQQPQQGNKQSGQVPEQQTPSHQQSSKQSQPSQSGNMKNSKHGGDIGEGDIEHPDQQPDKKVKIDDNPDETQKKVPNMQSKH
jgi:hypothetical protein